MLKDRLNDTTKVRLRRMFAHAGLEVGAYTGSFSEHRLRLFDAFGVQTVWDIGAHVGQYARSLRDNGYGGRIVSLEPSSAPYETLCRMARNDGLWSTLCRGAGQTDEEMTLNISANGQSSSLLPMAPRHRVGAPRSAYLGTERVRVRALDDIADELQESAPFALKLDVQGYEMEALGGAKRLLGNCAVAEVELSLSTLYDGGADWRHVVDHLLGEGFHLCDIDRVYYDPNSDDLLQIDGLFRRSKPT